MAATVNLETDLSDVKERLSAQESSVAGLKVNDHPFGFVLFTQRDTITKGLKLPVTFRVNPSGIPFAQDMVALDNMADTPYLLVEERTCCTHKGTAAVLRCLLLGGGDEIRTRGTE